MHINFVNKVQQQIQHIENSQPIAKAKTAASAAAVFFAKQGYFYYQQASVLSARAIVQVKTTFSHVYDVCLAYIFPKTPFFHQKLKKAIELEDTLALKNLLKSQSCSQQDLDKALIFAAMQPSSHFNTSIMLELLQKQQFSSFIRWEAILITIEHDKFNVFQTLLATAEMDNMKLREAFFKAILKGNEKCCNELYEICELDPKVLKQAYELASAEAKERLNWLAEQAYA